jgi:hypothetical protein
MRATVLVLLGLAGCRQVLGGFAELPDASGGADPSDGKIDPPDDDPTCFGTAIVEICLADTPTEPVDLTTQTIDSDTSPACVVYTSATDTIACVIAATALTVSGTVVATGSRPLVLVAATTIEVTGTIDVSSQRMRDPPWEPRIGAGGNSSACSGGSSAMGGILTGGGGRGGSFGGVGGTGGAGGAGGQGGVGAPAVSPTSLRGGCRGGRGGLEGSDAGPGGGAMFLVAKEAIAIHGTLNASGAGAGYRGMAVKRSGGGGGGSGGMIGLDAPRVTITNGARVFANGGGGAEGQTFYVGASGTESSAPATAAAGGGMYPIAGDGGSGSSGTALDGGRGADAEQDGGGGGGGGAGVIKIYPPQTTSSNVSPPAS